ncbi:MAG: hypothetical protein IKE65_04605 [Clostridia bacterium]|nr:hypothetical protein [Clostridia bacterium]
MRKIIAVFLLSVFLFCGGCALSKKPKAFVMSAFQGTVSIGENSFTVQIDFENEPQKVIMKAKDNAFDTVYTFHEKEVTLQYDEITTALAIKDLPDTNTAAVIYHIMSDLKNNKVRCKKEGEAYLFYATLNGTSYSGECDENGNILSFEVPAYNFYFSADK